MSCSAVYLLLGCVTSAALGLLLPGTHDVSHDASEPDYQMSSQSRGNFSGACTPFPHQRVVLVTVNYEYVDFFRNWLHYAQKFLQETERLLAVAEDDAVVPALKQVQKASHVKFSIAAHGAKSLVMLPDEGLPAVSLLEAPYGTQEYGEVVWRRPHYLLDLLSKGCTVLYVDIDTVWAKDPFLDIGARRGHDLYLVPDDSKAGKSDRMYFCSCFLYMQPTALNRQLVHWWSESARGNRNQFVFNRILKALKSKFSFEWASLPVEKYPPGEGVNSYPDASVIHANWVTGHDSKVCFMKARGLWAEEERQNDAACTDPVPSK